MQMSYWRFAAMIATSTAVMFGLMYVHTYVWDDALFSETRAWMALLMGATMALVMLGFMWSMYRNRTLNLAIVTAAVVVMASSVWLVRSQATVSGSDYMQAMVPHHSIAILTSSRARIVDPRVRKLADEIIEAQRKEIAEMKYLIASLRRDGARAQPSSTDEAATATPVPAPEALLAADLATTDLEPLTVRELRLVLGDLASCRFAYAAGEAPVAVATTARGNGGRAFIKLHGRLVPMEVRYPSSPERGFELRGDGVTVVTTPRDDGRVGGSREADAVLRAGDALEVGYAGYYECGAP